MTRKKPDEPMDALTKQIEQHLEALSKDPLSGRFHMDVPTLNLIGEVALGDKEEGAFTSQTLAEVFHRHLEKIFSNQVCDEHADRKNIAGCLELNLRMSAINGNPSQGVPGYVCIGTLYLKRTVQDHVVTFSFKRHPLLADIYCY